MVATANTTADNPPEILAYVDDDDPALDEYVAIDVQVVVGPRITLSDCWNQLANRASGDILHMAADDIRFRTPSWDLIVESVMARYDDGIVFVYGRDGYHDGRLGTHGFITRRWVDTVGYFTWPEFPADFADTWLHDLAIRINRAAYVPQVLIEHLHPLFGKAEWDRTHLERVRRGREADVNGLFERLAPQRVADAQKLEAVCFS